MTVCVCVCACVLGQDQREKVSRAGCRRTTEAGAGSSQSWGLAVVDGRLGLCKGHLPGVPPSRACSEDFDCRTGACIAHCSFLIPTAQIGLSLWKPGFFQRDCWWEVSGHPRGGRDGDRTMAKADFPTAASGPAAGVTRVLGAEAVLRDESWASDTWLPCFGSPPPIPGPPGGSQVRACCCSERASWLHRK